MIEAVAMKLQNVEINYFPAIGFFSKYRCALLADTFKIQSSCAKTWVRQARKFFGKTFKQFVLPETDCQNYLVLF